MATGSRIRVADNAGYMRRRKAAQKRPVVLSYVPPVAGADQAV